MGLGNESQAVAQDYILVHEGTAAPREPLMARNDFSGGSVAFLPSAATRMDQVTRQRKIRPILFRPRRKLPPKKQPRVLLLQGPVGPFFKRLQRFLERQGYDAWRVSFNAGDRLYMGKGKRIHFNGSKADWAAWLTSLLATSEIDHLILFGAERPIHTVARTAAEAHGINVISLEEGYIRPGFITVENGGNNWLSPVAGQLPPPDFNDDDEASRQKLTFKSFRIMCVYGAAYYSIRTLLTGLSQRELFHRPVQPMREMFAWSRNLFRRAAHSLANFATVEKLLEHYDRRYFIVPLQVTSDTQMGRAALGWSNVRLIKEALASFARTAPVTHRLVFKIHPLERGHSRDHELIRTTANNLGIADRVDVIDAGSLGLLTRHAAGMITINSTSGLSAIYHGIPLLVVGHALYGNDALATCARGKPDFDAFWRCKHVADATLRQRYLAWIRRMCLKPGDFYARDGIKTACAGVLEVIRAHQTEKSEALADLEAIRIAC